MLWEWIDYKTHLYRVKRRIGFLAATVGCFTFGMFHASKGKNYYTKGAHQGVMQVGDYPTSVMMGMGADNKKKYYL